MKFEAIKVGQLVRWRLGRGSSDTREGYVIYVGPPISIGTAVRRNPAFSDVLLGQRKFSWFGPVVVRVERYGVGGRRLKDAYFAPKPDRLRLVKQAPDDVRSED